MHHRTQYIGLDVHKETIAVAVAPGGPGFEERSLGTLPHDAPKLIKRLLKIGPAASLRVAYEAGPTGYGLCRRLAEAGIECMVVAPSKTPLRTGDRVKTDRRDALRLASFLRAGMLVAVTPPSRETEALRDALRAREDVVYAQRRARQQLSGFLLRQDRKWSKKTAWTQRHLLWIRAQRFDSEIQQQVLEDYVAEVHRLTDRLSEATERVEHYAAESEACGELFRALQALRGVGPIVAATVVAEIGDLRRFPSPSKLMSYVGLVPSERSSGARTQRGSITKAGNTHVRWKLIESAWHSRHRPAISIHMRRRHKDLSQDVIDIAWKAQKRLHKRYWSMVQRGKRTQHAVVAAARELVGFIWAIGQVVPAQPR